VAQLPSLSLASAIRKGFPNERRQSHWVCHVFEIDANYPPAFSRDSLKPIDVKVVLRTVSAMLIPVILQNEVELGVGQICVSDNGPGAAPNGHINHWLSHPGSQDQEPEHRFSGRVRSLPHENHGVLELVEASISAPAFNRGLQFGHRCSG
jgi:hypothetical protein